MHFVGMLHISFLGGPFTLRAELFEPLLRSRPLGGPSIMWICHIFCPFEVPSSLRSKILERLVRFRPLGGPCTLRSCYIFSF